METPSPKRITRLVKASSLPDWKKNPLIVDAYFNGTNGGAD